METQGSQQDGCPGVEPNILTHYSTGEEAGECVDGYLCTLLQVAQKTMNELPASSFRMLTR